MASDASPRRFVVVPALVLLGGLLAWAGSRGGDHAGLVPVFVYAVATAYVIQGLAFVPAWLRQTERHFDLTGAATYIGVTALVLALVPERGPRSWLLGGLVCVWAARLGSFLFTRIRRAGSDGRFDEIKTDPWRFLAVWTMQGLWVSLTASAAWIAISGGGPRGLDVWAAVGALVWAGGFAIEVIADRQKSAFNAQHKGRFVDVGLWSRSRHPNYFGEIVLWIGVAIIAVPALSGWQWVGLLSPVFVALLLTRVSGIPMLEARAEQKWGDDPAYRAYVERTPVLIPRLTSAGGTVHDE